MYTKYYLLGTIALFLLSGCTGLPLDKHEYPDPAKIDEYNDEIKNHVIAIGKEGELRDPLTSELMNGHKKEDRYILNIVQNIKEYSLKKTAGEAEVIIYIHGGLNKESSGLKRALANYQLIQNSGKYPVFINWNSEGIRSYGSHLIRVRQGELRPLRAKLTSPLYLLTDIGNSLITAPKAWYVTSEHLIDSLTFRDDIDDVLDSQKGTHNQAHKDLVHITKREEKSNLFRHIQWIATSPFKVVTTPFAYTLAKPAWDIMLRRTNTLFYTPNDLRRPLKSSPSKSTELNANKTITRRVIRPGTQLKGGNGALYKFLSALEMELEKCEMTSKVKISLIGHSMGAIVVNQIVNLGLDLRYENIVHLASADSIENLFNKVVPYIDCSLEGTCNKGFPVRFYSLHLHPDNENRETSGRGFIPSGSLLTWIDNMYTVPKTVLDKRSGRWDNMTRAIKLIPPVKGIPKKQNDIKGQMHFTIFGIQKDKECTKDELKGLNCTAQEHGDFGDLPFWREEVWTGEHLSAQGE